MTRTGEVGEATSEPHEDTEGVTSPRMGESGSRGPLGPNGWKTRGWWRGEEAQRSFLRNERRCNHVTLTHRQGSWVGVGRRAAWRRCVFRASSLTMEARMGRKSEAVATLLVHSVKAATMMQRIRTMVEGDTDWSGVSLFPSHCDRPDTCGQRKVVCERLGSLESWNLMLRFWKVLFPSTNV